MDVKKILTGIGVSFVAIVTSLALAGTAQAADLTLKTTDDNPGGQLEFTAYGDIVKLCDTDADGWRAVAYVFKPSGATQYKFAVSGNGNCKTHRANQGSPYNLKEGTTYTFRVCIDHDNNNQTDDRFCREAAMKA